MSKWPRKTRGKRKPSNRDEIYAVPLRAASEWMICMQRIYTLFMPTPLRAEQRRIVQLLWMREILSGRAVSATPIQQMHCKQFSKSRLRSRRSEA